VCQRSLRAAESREVAYGPRATSWSVSWGVSRVRHNAGEGKIRQSGFSDWLGVRAMARRWRRWDDDPVRPLPEYDDLNLSLAQAWATLDLVLMGSSHRLRSTLT
jgi:hypothetical protein